MSIKAMTLVWERFPRGGSDMLVALALADWCNDQGLSLHPSIRAIAVKCRLSEWQARRIVHQMISDGLLEIVGNHFGGAPGASRQYRFRLDLLTPSAGATPSAHASPTPSAGATPSTGDRAGTHARDGWHPCTETASTHASLTVIEPSIDVRDTSDVPATEKASKKRACKKSIPEDFGISESVRKWAKAQNFNQLDQRLEHFVGYAKANGKKYVDWDAAFMNAIRGDWAKLNRQPTRGSGGIDARFAN
ncbi:hypothetical protein R69608_05538 [Paraburkholderia nemoris]|nr:hypothetical protein R69608_05538 [Paraburkholderia nemoris]